MSPRILLLFILMEPVFFFASRARGAEEARGWGSSWTKPHSEQEKVVRDISDRLEKAIRAQDWDGVEKALDAAQRAGLKSASLTGLRAIVAIGRQRYDEAVSYCDSALALLPAKDQPTTASNLLTLRASANALAGNGHAARADLERALAADKKNLLAQNNYAWLLATCPDASVRDGKRAVKFARAVSGDKESAVFLDTLAAAEAEAGNFRAAVKDEKRALDLAGKNRAICEQHLQSYLNNTPVRDSPESRQADFTMRSAGKR